MVTGAAASSKGGNGKLMFLDKNTLEAVKTLEVDSTPVKVFWHSKINQVRRLKDSRRNLADGDRL